MILDKPEEEAKEEEPLEQRQVKSRLLQVTNDKNQKVEAVVLYPKASIQRVARQQEGRLCSAISRPALPRRQQGRLLRAAVPHLSGPLPRASDGVLRPCVLRRMLHRSHPLAQGRPPLPPSLTLLGMLGLQEEHPGERAHGLPHVPRPH